MNRIPEVIKHIIIINVLFFAATWGIKTIDLNELFNLHYWENPNFRAWQLVTGIFMHASIGHLFFNMLGLYFFGSPIVQLYGKNKFLFFYFSAGIGASLIYLFERQIEFTSVLNTLQNMGASKQEIYDLFSTTKRYADENLQTANSIYNMRLLGASGAIFGLLAAYGWNFPESEIYLYFVIKIKAKYFIPVIVLADLFSGLTGQPLLSPVNTAYFAHVGGAIIGLIIAIVWKKNQYRRY
ncbi:membrane associated rhomboid family serine protease [Wenyingzhuangia heitensis]|uniref:Membrane associated rhomboid family serine protease n=1 Tax=Wenyingzhuangia heitensis TaxID=1487859 RepID=A0ABX0U8L1_9FLAO|nr:rhomboid family intramembrane serine protease [Wenyingzhuangia heitensis]NIJ45098.1 membrane associated rhomboid family serine protease [Wenyingzhuangia heitensis]